MGLGVCIAEDDPPAWFQERGMPGISLPLSPVVTPSGVRVWVLRVSGTPRRRRRFRGLWDSLARAPQRRGVWAGGSAGWCGVRFSVSSAGAGLFTACLYAFGWVSVLSDLGAEPASVFMRYETVVRSPSLLLQQRRTHHPLSTEGPHLPCGWFRCHP